MAHVRSPRWDADGDEGDVAGGGVAVVAVGDDAAAVAVVVLALDDHGVEGNGWKAGQWWARETFGLEMWACPSARACHPWVNPQEEENHCPEAARLTYWVGPHPRYQVPSLIFCIWTFDFETRFSPEMENMKH